MCVKTTAPKLPSQSKHKEEQFESLQTLGGSTQRTSGHRNLTSSSSAPVVLTSVTPMGQDYGDVAKSSAQESVSLTKKDTKSHIAKGVLSPTQSASPSPELQSLIASSTSSDDREPRFV